MKRRAAEQPDAHASCQRMIRDAEEALGRYDKAIEGLMAKHAPKFREDEWGLRPGNSHSPISFYCVECSRTWPCDPFNDLRFAFGEAHKWPEAKTPYAPLKLHLTPAPAAPENPAHRPTSTEEK